MIDLIAKDQAAWRELLRNIRENQRFTQTDDVDKELELKTGTPILLCMFGCDFHVYPPANTGDWAMDLLKRRYAPETA